MTTALFVSSALLAQQLHHLVAAPGVQVGGGLVVGADTPANASGFSSTRDYAGPLALLVAAPKLCPLLTRWSGLS